MRNIAKNKNFTIEVAPFKILICVCLGGAMGATFRYVISSLINFDYFALEMFNLVSSLQSTTDFSSFFSFFHVFFSLFPIGILSVNILGSFLIGAFITYSNVAQEKDTQSSNGKQKSPTKALHAFFVTGFLGSLTTFSTFTLDSIKLLLPTILKSDCMQNFALAQDFSMHYIINNAYLSVYSQSFIAHHAFTFAFLNILVNVLFCVFAVWCGGKLVYHYNS